MTETVTGEKHLMTGKRCPRCLGVQWKIRRVVAYKGETGDMVLYSCLGCKRVISLQIEPADQKENPHEALAKS